MPTEIGKGFFTRMCGATSRTKDAVQCRFVSVECLLQSSPKFKQARTFVSAVTTSILFRRFAIASWSFVFHFPFAALLLSTFTSFDKTLIKLAMSNGGFTCDLAVVLLRIATGDVLDSQNKAIIAILVNYYIDFFGYLCHDCSPM